MQRVDVVFDRYISGSLKSETREGRGSGIRILVNEATPIWKNWQKFLRNDENKKELFHLLAVDLTSESLTSCVVVATDSEEVLSSEATDLTFLTPCNHEEADTRIFLHVKHCPDSGHSKVAIRTIDTDVVVIAISCFHSLEVEELWIEFGVGKSRRWLPVHSYVHALGQDVCKGLPFWYAFTGCDTVLSFSGKGKKIAWNTWKAFPEATDTFARLSNGENGQPSDIDVKMIERFVVLMYQRTSSLSDVNECRRYLFTKKGCPSESLPPTSDALLQHTRRAIFQAGFVWCQSTVKTQHLPPIVEWGWNENVSPLWMVVPEASKACQELIKCGCRQKCSTRCKCRQFGLECTELCMCNGQCLEELDI
ncbi:uncharacterized protein LOC135694220 [Rhopilema esculentum]|uniref:uncharacterized protein LOC135694220 n=1 Tax=Rhopilema esculentum TaxID=499914 RepID=UPI0031D4FF4E